MCVADHHHDHEHDDHEHPDQEPAEHEPDHDDHEHPTTTTTPIVPQCLTNASCDDGHPCNSIETCAAGVCTSGTPLDCDDGDPCTMDSCDAGAGCQHTTVADLASCSTVIPGGGKKKSDCYVLAGVQGTHARSRRLAAGMG